MTFIRKLTASPRFINWFSWGVTVLIVVGLLVFTSWKITPQQVSAPPEPTPTEEGAPASPPAATGLYADAHAIVRHIALKTQIDRTTNYQVNQYTIHRGDSIFGIAALYKIKPETVYWANYDLFQGNPDNLSVGQVLNIPPLDGIYYKWEQGDDIASVAEKFKVEQDVILNWPGNDLDLTNPQIPVGTFVMIPGAEKNDQPLFIQTVSRASSPAAAACGGGYPSRGYFSWPADNHFLSGYNFGETGHRGIDIAANEGASIRAADSGVVTMASVGDWNYGYGNVVQIDHGNGFVTVYAHLSQVFVNVCDPVMAGAPIGAAGNTGNSFGAHLHFEIRLGGSPVNPWDYLLAQ
jgi:murein DD-endopeptidase MepM/ murein hydrolase activator NlpD